MKIKTAIIGTGNIGTDILLKLQRSEILECGMFILSNVHPYKVGKIVNDTMKTISVVVK